MLIVIVVIGILAGAILPKIMGVMSRARDTKRVSDLRNVAMAIESYKMDTGEYPRLSEIYNGNQRYYSNGNPGLAGSLSNLKDNLADYMTDMPKDPQKNNVIYIHKIGRQRNLMYSEGWLREGEYLYQLGNHTTYQTYPDFALLVAKVETPVYANYVLINEQEHACDGCAWWPFIDRSPLIYPNSFSGSGPYFCSSVRKVSEGEEQPATADNSECKYSSEDQLYYIMKI